VVNDTWDPGWSATVDGESADVLPANSTFRAIPIEAGTHAVELRYRPASYALGVWISLGTLLVTLGALGALAIRRRTRPAGEATPSRDTVTASS
jgi:uncharacterized membrane protein YfhO